MCLDEARALMMRLVSLKKEEETSELSLSTQQEDDYLASLEEGPHQEPTLLSPS